MKEEKEMSFLEHLEELRWHVIRSLFAIIIITIVVFIFSKWIYEEIIFAPSRLDFPTFQWLCRLGKSMGTEESLCIKKIPVQFISRNMMGQFTIDITSSFIMGLIIAFPYIAFEIWRFIRPGLHKRERQNSRGAVAAISFLFFLGVSFGYYIMSPLAVYFFSNYQVSEQVQNTFDITSYVSTIAILVLGSGVLFQLPIVIFFLSQIGIVTPAFLKRYRKHSVVIILVIAAIITPPDPLSQTLISIPLYMLYECSILISGIVVRRKAKQEAAEAAAEGRSPDF